MRNTYCWLVAESNLEKKVQSSTQKYRTPSKTAKWNQKNYYCFKVWTNLNFFLRKLTKISNLIRYFSEIPKKIICVLVRQVTFLSEDWKKLSFWNSFLFTVCALEMHEREAWREQTGSNVPALVNKVPALGPDQFMQVWLHTVSWLHDYLQIRKPKS